METQAKTAITVQATVDAPVEKVWKLWTTPVHIMKWNNASDDWHTPRAENDVRPGGKFVWHMAAKDGSTGFDFSGTYTRVDEKQLLEYILDDNRKVRVTFIADGNQTTIIETFEAENMNPTNMQRMGWQAILDNFRKYAENYGKIEKLTFEITINAMPETVFKIMLEDKTYRQWTAEFNPTSYFEGSWGKGSKILFLGTDQNGNQGGMLARIREHIPNSYISIEHYGIIQNGKEVTSGHEVDEWAPSQENYTFTETNGKTQLKIEMDSNQEYKVYFKEAWPRALKKLKSLCEEGV